MFYSEIDLMETLELQPEDTLLFMVPFAHQQISEASTVKTN